MAIEAPGAFVYLWFQQKGTKRAVVVLVGDHLLTIASVRMLRIGFLIDFFVGHKLSKGY